MIEITEHKRETSESTASCSRCGWYTYPRDRWSTEDIAEKHEKACSLASSLGLEPVLAEPCFMNLHSRPVVGWQRAKDKARLVIYLSQERRVKRPLTWLEVREQEYSLEECEAGLAFAYDTEHVTELRLEVDGDYRNPIEVYVVPDDWDWRTDELPWDAVPQATTGRINARKGMA